MALEFFSNWNDSVILYGQSNSLPLLRSGILPFLSICIWSSAHLNGTEMIQPDESAKG